MRSHLDLDMASDLVRRRVAVIVTPLSTAATFAAKAATTTIPIVFSTGIDPVQAGLVLTLNRPGGNVTGFVTMNNEIGAKRLEHKSSRWRRATWCP
jgi:putative tryptophan/tyrosine transport system substrate-binding protein